MSDYKSAAYERTFAATLQRYVLDTFLKSDSAPKEAMICEEVFVNESEVPQEFLQLFFEKLVIWENDARTRMSEFKWTRDQPTLPFLEKRASEGKKNAEAKPKSKPKKRKTEPGPEGSDGASG